MSNTSAKTLRLTVTAVLAAITVILAFVPLRTLGLEITFTMIPIAIGSILCGPAAGAVLGGIFGVVSFLQCLGYSAFGAALLEINPIFTFIVCVPTRILAGFLAGVIYRALCKPFHSDIPAILSASLAAPLFNTVFFMATLVALFYRCELIQYYANLLGAANPFMFIILFVGVNGLVEIICGFAVAFPSAKALSKIFQTKS